MKQKKVSNSPGKKIHNRSNGSGYENQSVPKNNFRTVAISAQTLNERKSPNDFERNETLASNDGNND